jgi:putative DNA primase/helicase
MVRARQCSRCEATAVTHVTLTEVHAPSNAMANARDVVEKLFTNGDGLLLRSQHCDFYRFDGRCWPEIEATELRALLYEAFEHATYVDVGKTGPESKPFRPNRSKVGELVEALRAVTLLPGSTAAPAWLDDTPTAAAEFVPVANGLLHLRERELVPHTPRYWCHHAAAVEYDPGADPPERWFAFLDELWGNDDEPKDLLGELFGYLLSTDTTQQKAALIIGPKRAGKGVIGRVLTGLLGAHNVAGPTLASLGTNFGLAPLIGKPVAIISDARLGRADAQVVVERLLAISGEDALTIDRKHREPWTGRLPTRFVVITNELPTFADTSGALASRFVILNLTRSFYGGEDPTLTDRLLPELSGILNWALDSLDRLRARGRLTQPASSAATIRELEDLASPMGAFIRDRCITGAEYAIAVVDLFDAWKTWCAEQGRSRPENLQTFGRNLRTVLPGLTTTNPRDDIGKRHRHYQGLDLARSGARTLSLHNALGENRENRRTERNGADRAPARTKTLEEIMDEPF